MDRPEWTTAVDGTPILHIYTDEQLDAYAKDALQPPQIDSKWLLYGLLAIVAIVALRKK